VDTGSAVPGDEDPGPPIGARWQQQLHTWETVRKKFSLQNDRWAEFQYLQFLDISDPAVVEYVQFHVTGTAPRIKGRLREHSEFWLTLHTPTWLLDVIKNGFSIPLVKEPPRILLPNCKAVEKPENANFMTKILKEYLASGFIEIVTELPYCVLPLQLKESPDKVSLIFDMSPLNEFVKKDKFKLEGWEEMFVYAAHSNFAIKFDIRKYYYAIDIKEGDKKFFGFMYTENGDTGPVMYTWTVLPFGYTRAPFLARQLMKPLLAKWRALNIDIIVFFDDGMAVAENEDFLKKASLQILCDLLRAGLVPGVEKCRWIPEDSVSWNGLVFDFRTRGISIMQRRMEKAIVSATELLDRWPAVTFRDVSRVVGRFLSMHPVFSGKEQILTKTLQTFVNIRNYDLRRWDDMITAGYAPLFEYAEAELTSIIEFFPRHNFRSFKAPLPSAIAWVDASDRAIGGFLVELNAAQDTVPLTADGLIFDSLQAKTWLRNCEFLRTDNRLETYHDGCSSLGDLSMHLSNVKKSFIVHRNLAFDEQATDSNERELLAALNLLQSCGSMITKSVLTLYFDNQTASIVVTKGSNKPRLQKYAIQILDLCMKHAVMLNPVWIPRDLNNFADMLSKTTDYEDYSITNEFFSQICRDFGVSPVLDCFANNVNKKIDTFFSPVFCPGTSGVDAFAFNWKLFGVAWIFPPPRLLLRCIQHLKNLQASGLILLPQWKNTTFYPAFRATVGTRFCLRKIVYNGQGCFLHGADPLSYFGPEFRGNVEVYYLNFSS